MTNYWDLAEKDVVNIKNGEVIGRFDDVEIDTRKGKITAFYIEEGSKFMGMLGKTKPKISLVLVLQIITEENIIKIITSIFLKYICHQLLI